MKLKVKIIVTCLQTVIYGVSLKIYLEIHHHRLLHRKCGILGRTGTHGVIEILGPTGIHGHIFLPLLLLRNHGLRLQPLHQFLPLLPLALRPQFLPQLQLLPNVVLFQPGMMDAPTNVSKSMWLLLSRLNKIIQW